jgi:hypothetical protein
MEKITSQEELRESIILLEIKQASQKKLLKEQFMITYESVKPVNLIKNKFNDIVSSPNLKENLLNAALSLAAGYLSKKVIIGSTQNPLKQLFGTLLQVGVTGIVSKNSDGIKSTAMDIIGKILRKKTQPIN